ncbi:Uma2 family endonuclease [Candidatus Cyanaurora vandensis]|uniref:Uma2 family endonuclease n=1 Tax=Candidatus Cyanaurora vandensis TaxID=2714958 RepID=UPI00257EEF33|nr:Uma2 family endonuclease [Candidatus Cyanaurora vandensis]
MLEPLIRASLPTMDDLPREEVGKPGLPDEFHCLQGPLLSLTFRPPAWPITQVFSAYDLYLYYDVNHTLWYKRPDWFGAVGVPSLDQGQHLRQSYVIWQEQVTPVVAIEILSPGTENEDLGKIKRKPGKPPTKWEVYEQILQIPNYVIYDETAHTLKLFQLTAGQYEQKASSQTRVWIPELELSLGLWHGFWNKSTEWWLRWYDRAGKLIPTPEEVQQQDKELAQQQVVRAEYEKELARERAGHSEQQADRLAAKLRELGLDPEQI